MCCKLLGVEGIQKAAGVWCPLCKPGKGCTAYSTRPNDCQTYTCLWLQMREEGVGVGDALRPDRCKVVIDATLDGKAHHVRPDPGSPAAWRHPALQGLLTQLGQFGPLFLVLGDQRRQLTVL